MRARFRLAPARATFTPHRLSTAPAPPTGTDFYGPAVTGAATIGRRALDPDLRQGVLAETAELEQDDYVDYVNRFVEAGLARGGSAWRYADITTVLAAAAELLRPSSYLEIGVRRGRSMAIVARRAVDCSIIGVDIWNEGYAGMANPGPAHVAAELERVGHRGEVSFLSGDSHVIVPRLLSDRPELSFDLVTVDGDHSEAGARRDLETVLPRIRVGGALVFDDISHSAHPGLHRVWQGAVASNRRFATWEFDDVGYGVAVAVRRW